ncbi:MAG: tRNA uridine-5-carboxymethylaminomethyl(34) synthesis GTPase MnmE [Candidatus Omnitrophica bacterium]|nr:tRNA uridine-5-carboxymethylaminomethyl(34) synthesis GTPase MnmE [Candidatus Omnitrophota bacterium]
MRSFKLKDYILRDTIAAVSTFPSKSALGVIKISGKRALTIANKIFTPKHKKDLKKVKNFTIHYGWIKDIDEVLVSVMRGPHSYTTENVIEISSHGGAVVLNKILQTVLDCGARLALVGEFTYRALVYGRIDLFQAQSICNIVEARSSEGLKLAQAQLRGESSQTISKLKEEVKDLFTQFEAYINFPEDQISFSKSLIRKRLKKAFNKIDHILDGSKEAKVLTEGLRCVICGRANVGKSTLFNRLLKQERVIVSHISGTTRDVVEETISIKGVPLKIYDTAGIFEGKDLITKRAIEHSHRAFDEADLIILLLDGSKPLSKDDNLLLKKIDGRNVIICINKSDLKQKINLKAIKGRKVRLSALRNKGIKDLEEAVHKAVYKDGISRQDMIFLSQHQSKMLKEAKSHISQACDFFDQGYTVDFTATALKNCLDSLGALSGDVLSQDILKSIFSNFCIGK